MGTDWNPECQDLWERRQLIPCKSPFTFNLFNLALYLLECNLEGPESDVRIQRCLLRLSTDRENRREIETLATHFTSLESKGLGFGFALETSLAEEPRLASNQRSFSESASHVPGWQVCVLPHLAEAQHS